MLMITTRQSARTTKALTNHAIDGKVQEYASRFSELNNEAYGNIQALSAIIELTMEDSGEQEKILPII